MAGTSRPRSWGGRSRTSSGRACRSCSTPPACRSRARDSDAGAPLRGRFGNEAGAPLAHFEDVVIAPRGITRIDDFVVRRLRLDLHGEAVAFATYAFDL